MFEVSESELKPVNNATMSFAGGSWAGVVRECVAGALATKLISAEDQIVSLYHRRATASLSSPFPFNLQCQICLPRHRLR